MQQWTLGGPWVPHGLPMGCPWGAHGCPWGAPWVPHGCPWDAPCGAHGCSWVPRWCPWAVHGCPCGAHGVPMGDHGVPMWPHGVTIGCPWAAHGCPWGAPWVPMGAHGVPHVSPMGVSGTGLPTAFEEGCWFVSGARLPIADLLIGACPLRMHSGAVCHGCMAPAWRFRFQGVGLALRV